MPALTTLTINNGASPAVPQVFVPQGKPNGVATFKKSDGTPVGDHSLTVSSTHGTRHKVSLRLKLPQVVTQTVNGVQTEVVVRTAFARVDFDFASDSTLAERKDAIALISNGLLPAQTAISAVFADLNDFY